MEKFKRYLIFLLGLFISSLGVSFVTRANLGFPYFVDSICPKSSIFLDTWQFHHRIQHPVNLTTAADFTEKLQIRTPFTDSCFHCIRLFY